jgi:hypothetical protein
VISIIYRKLSLNDPMRRLLVDIYVDLSELEWFDTSGDKTVEYVCNRVDKSLTIGEKPARTLTYSVDSMEMDSKMTVLKAPSSNYEARRRLRKTLVTSGGCELHLYNVILPWEAISPDHRQRDTTASIIIISMLAKHEDFPVLVAAAAAIVLVGFIFPFACSNGRVCCDQIEYRWYAKNSPVLFVLLLGSVSFFGSHVV